MALAFLFSWVVSEYPRSTAPLLRGAFILTHLFDVPKERGRERKAAVKGWNKTEESDILGMDEEGEKREMVWGHKKFVMYKIEMLKHINVSVWIRTMYRLKEKNNLIFFTPTHNSVSEIII